MSGFRQYLRENADNNEQSLNESSITRFLRHFQKYDAAIITAFRDGFTKRENKARNKELFSALYAAGYSITRVDGSYIENFDTKDAVTVAEESYVVVNYKEKSNFHATIKKLGIKYEQDSVLLIHSGDKPSAELFGTNRDSVWPAYGTGEKTGKLSLSSGNQFFTRLRNKEFAFLTDEDKEEKRKRNNGKVNENNYIDVGDIAPTSRLSKQGCVTVGNRILSELGQI